jgi:hypothetical protein
MMHESLYTPGDGSVISLPAITVIEEVVDDGPSGGIFFFVRTLTGDKFRCCLDYYPNWDNVKYTWPSYDAIRKESKDRVIQKREALIAAWSDFMSKMPPNDRQKL